MEKAGLDLAKFAPDYVRAALDTCKGKFKIFSELPAYCGFYFTDDISYNPEGVAKHFIPENMPRLLAVREAFAQAPCRGLEYGGEQARLVYAGIQPVAALMPGAR